MEMKYRHEYKYVCNAKQNAILKLRADGILKKDKHVGMDGAYRIRSLYFDDWNDRCYYENESGIGERDKYRIRIYNEDITRITLEKKSKSRGMTLKTGCSLTREECMMLMKQEIPGIRQDMSSTKQCLLTELMLREMRPVVIVEYVRYPYVEKAGNVRITFDEDIRSSNDLGDFLEKNIKVRPIMEKGQSILEVKWDEFIPGYIKQNMDTNALQRSSFSKYYLCRRFNTYGGSRL